MDDYGVQNRMNNGEQLEKPMSLSDWLVTLLILAIPCVGIVMMFVWGFGQGNINRRNYCRATLIFTAIAVVLIAIFYASIFAFILSAIGSYSY